MKRCSVLFAMAFLCAAFTAPRSQGQSQSGTAAAIDKGVYDGLRDTINTGAELFNKFNDHMGCYRVYQGALLAIQPLLGHRPALQKAINDGLVNAERKPAITERAFTLRTVIDQIRAETKPGGSSLWDRLGGEANVKKVVDDFVAAAATDPKVNFDRNGKFKLDVPAVANFKTQLVALISEVSGGPIKYTGRSMKESHQGMGITDAEFDALAGHLVRALVRGGAKDEDVQAVVTVVAGTRKDIVEAKGIPTKASTLWERLGGEANVKRVVDDFVAAAATDPKVNFDRGGKYKLDALKVADLKRHLVAQISHVSGGPYKYTGRDMKESHQGMGITDDEFNAAGDHLVKALRKNGAKEDDIAAVVGVVAAMRKDIVERAAPATTTLWDRLGGEANVKRVVDDLVTLAATDPKVDFFRGGKIKLDDKSVAELKRKLVEFVSIATGGPLKYSGRTMKDSHQGMGITNGEFNALAGHLEYALKKNGAKPEDIAAVIKAVEGTRKDIVEK